MALESLITKLNQNLEMAKDNLRAQLSDKVNQLTKHLEDFSSAEIRGELENLVDDFLSQFTIVYQEFISYVEDELPSLPKPPKKIKTKIRSEAHKKEFVRPTYVHRAFTDGGLRVSKDARPMIMEFLNKKIKEDIESIKKQLPKFMKGERKGEKKRITLKPEDLSDAKLLQKDDASVEKELEAISLDLNGKDYKLLILLRQFQKQN
ncbi:MAG: hypothetical protein HWN66_02030 [Candidatus Helarchaeota archaeon]|nr:hypothetical protein [Candidatus Helarchaeota archaeon]